MLKKRATLQACHKLDHIAPQIWNDRWKSNITICTEILLAKISTHSGFSGDQPWIRNCSNDSLTLWSTLMTVQNDLWAEVCLFPSKTWWKNEIHFTDKDFNSALLMLTLCYVRCLLRLKRCLTCQAFHPSYAERDLPARNSHQSVTVSAIFWHTLFVYPDPGDV